MDMDADNLESFNKTESKTTSLVQKNNNTAKNVSVAENKMEAEDIEEEQTV